MVSQAQRAAMKRYEDKLDTFLFKLRKDNDKEIIDRLRSVPCITGYIRSLVRRDIEGTENDRSR